MSPENELSIINIEDHITERFAVKQGFKRLVGLDFLAFGGEGLTLNDLGGILGRH